MLQSNDTFSDVCAMCNIAQSAAGNLTQTVLLVSSLCGHKFCRKCTERTFAMKRQFACPLCGVNVKRNTLSEKSLDELEVSKDFQIRKRVKSIFNKKESDFSTLKEYCDYQEMAEDIVYNLLHGIDIEMTESQIEFYQSQNLSQIRENQAREAEEDRKVSERIRQEAKETDTNLQRLQELDALKRQQEQELERQRMQIMMGERDHLSAEVASLDEAGKSMSRFMTLASGPEDGGAQFNSHNASNLLEQLRRMHPLPKVVPQERIVITAGDQPRRSAAGGFSILIHQQKNWKEAMSSLGCVASLCGNITDV